MGFKVNEIIKQNNIPHLILLYGSEQYLKRQFRDNIVRALIPADNGMNLSKYSNISGKIDESRRILDNIIGLANTAPFFSDKRVILCENTGFFKNKFDTFPDFLKNCPDTSYLIFVEREINRATLAYKTINKLGFTEEYNMPNERTLISWINNKIRSAGLSIEHDAVVEFISRTSSNMDNMDSEINKLISYSMNKKNITLLDVQKISTPNYEEQIFNIINAIAAKNKSLAMKEYSYLYILKTNPRIILSHLTSKFSQILDIEIALKKGMSPYDVQTQLNLKDYPMKKNMETAKLFKESSLRNILKLSEETARKINTGLLNEQTGIELFIIKCLSA